MQSVKQIILDNRFENGFAVKPQLDGNDEIIGYLTYGSFKNSIPTMVLAQWYCGYWVINNAEEYARHNILNGYSRNDGAVYEWGDASKILRLNPISGEVGLELNTSREYKRDRALGEPWPHILVEYQTDVMPVCKAEKVELQLDLCLDKAVCCMDREDAELHTAQFVWYAILKNTNPAKNDYGKYIWFGCTFYDSRYENIPFSAEIDGGKEINTGMLIYKPATTEYMQGRPKIGEKKKIRYDITAQLKDAYIEACRREQFTDTDFEDLAITGGNIGWEVTGTYDVGMSIGNMALNVINK